jgi:hypothetical protein
MPQNESNRPYSGVDCRRSRFSSTRLFTHLFSAYQPDLAVFVHLFA